MDFVTEIALNALARATTPQDAERAATDCERRADDVEPDSPKRAGNRAAATALRALARSAPREPRPLTISYVGLPVRLDPTRIDPDKHVVPDYPEPTCGEDAARLFMDAVDAAAIAQPADIMLECYGDDDTDAGGFILVAFGAGRQRGVTCGWREVKNISGDSPEDALEFMVAELNAALGVRTPPKVRLTHVAIAAKQPSVHDTLRQIIAQDPHSVVSAVSGGEVSEVANLAGQDIDVLAVEVGPRTRGYTVEDLDVLAETFPHTPILVIPTAGAPARDTIQPFATGGMLADDEISTSALREAIAKAAHRDDPTAPEGESPAAGEQ